MAFAPHMASGPICSFSGARGPTSLKYRCQSERTRWICTCSDRGRRVSLQPSALAFHAAHGTLRHSVLHHHLFAAEAARRHAHTVLMSLQSAVVCM